MTTSALVRIRPHPTDDAVVILEIPHDLNHDLSFFQPARLAREHHGYVLHHDHLPAFHRFAANRGWHVTDDRARPPGPRTLMPECTDCSQPARLTNQPNRCPACGQPWRPAFYQATNGAPTGHHECPTCGHRQLTSFGYCGHCGAPMPTVERSPRVTPRAKLDEPMHVSQTLAETFPAVESQDVR